MNFSTEESKENDLIIKAVTGNIKTRTIRDLLFSLTLQAVRINYQGAPFLGLAKSIYIVHRKDLFASCLRFGYKWITDNKGKK